MPYRYDQVRNPYAGSIADMLLRQGDIAAQSAQTIGNAQAHAAQAIGNARAGAAANIGGSIAGSLGDLARYQAAAPQREMQQIQLQAARQGLTEHTEDRARQAQAQHDELAAQIGHQILLGGGTPDAVQAVMGRAVQAGALSPEEAQQFHLMSVEHAEKIPEAAQALLARSANGQALLDKMRTPKPRELGERDPTKDIWDKQTGQIITPGVPKPEKPEKVAEPPKLGTFDDYLTRYAVEKGKDPTALTTKEIEDARKRYQQADDRPRVTDTAAAGQQSDVKESVAGMLDGTLPPQMPGRASKDYTAIMAEAHRQGYDLAAAVTDWNATQKHVATMNGSKFTALRSSIDTASESLDVIQGLADKWKGGRFPALNKGNLALAKAGAYGKEAASIATQLDGQITDVTSELGQVYMGGNSPTDHALGLAEKNLRADWDQKVLTDMIGLARTNLKIRRNSITHSAPAAMSGGEPMPTAAPAKRPGTIRARDPQGVLHEAPAGTALPAGWKLEG